ncbi:MAG: tyrosine-type recombinase/integrase [Lachnospiraceae bacterium]|nr:tyrosine-type recombinase/integrase [Lachnospiraceae bacterium]
MNTLETHIKNYLFFCKSQKCLDEKTLKAYRIDLVQFANTIGEQNISLISIDILESYIAFLHKTYKPKTAKRKIASTKAFYHYLEYRDVILINPFNKMHVKFREPIILPKTIPLPTLEHLLKTIYEYHNTAKNSYQSERTLRDIAIIEVLFSTGIRISELCSLKASDINLSNNTILIFGKGSKERQIQIGNEKVAQILRKYEDCFHDKINETNHFFVNHSGKCISDQSIRRMIKKYASLSNINMRITPHMFRHTFATSLLESDVDIRYIQDMLGHSSINITAIYTHVSATKQKDILRNKHPRKDFDI